MYCQKERLTRNETPPPLHTAFMSKDLVRAMQCQDSVLAQVVRQKDRRDNPSVWNFSKRRDQAALGLGLRFVCKGAEVLRGSTRRAVGNGSKIRVLTDPWLTTPLLFLVIVQLW